MKLSTTGLISFALLATSAAFPLQPTRATGGQFGLEFAIDAPWRLEPVLMQGRLSYGPIPITVAFHDALFEMARKSQITGPPVANLVLPEINVGKLQEIRIIEWTEGSEQPVKTTSVILPSMLREVERRTLVSTKAHQPDTELCQPDRGDCTAMLDISKTHDWQASLWYTPKTAVTPGRNIHLEVVAVTAIADGSKREWKNYLVVHAGEAPLPRFGDDWLYGDLHYHSQNTDNEGETGYGYRNVSRALGAMGMDFVFATDHASNGEQFDGVITGSASEFCPGGVFCTEARDYNVNRFAAAKTILYGSEGVNRAIAQEAETGGLARLRSANILPQIYLGEEVDAIPEIADEEHRSGELLFGDSLKYLWPNSNECIQKKGMASCQTTYSTEYAPRDHQSFLVLDEQGIPVEETIDSEVGNETLATFMKWITPDKTEAAPSRQHIVYFPNSVSADSTGWIASDTGKYGGGGKRLQDVIAEIQAGGVAFLAHPIDAHSPGGPVGPDIVPYSDRALMRAWRSPTILGLQLWNENDIYNSAVNDSSLPAMTVAQTGSPTTTSYRFNFPYQGPEANQFPWSWQKAGGTIRTRDLYHGAFTWDRYLRKGLDPTQTAELAWLAAGQPRKWFMAGGSDAHGDFNYRRHGRPCEKRWCDVPVADTAIGTPRNLVAMTRRSDGLPAVSESVIGIPDGPKRYSNQQVIQALRSGEFSVTDGPAIRVAIDRNRNGIIDSSDVPMGGTLNYYRGEHIPLLIEWFSSREFGPVAQIDVFVGNAVTTFAPKDFQPPRPGGGTSYSADPSGALKVRPGSPGSTSGILPSEIGFSGIARVFVGPAQFQLATNNGSLSYMRATASTIANLQNESRSSCGPAGRAGSKCGNRFAYSNPVWARFQETCPPVSPHPTISGGTLIGGIADSFVDANKNSVPDTCERSVPNPCRAGAGTPFGNIGINVGQPPAASTGSSPVVTVAGKPIPNDSCQTIAALTR